MKKIIINIILGIILLLPNQVNADMAAPYFDEYDAIVTPSSGTTAYSYNYDTQKMTPAITISKGTRVKVTYESYLNNDWYAHIYYSNEYYYLKMNDLMLANATYDMSKVTKVSKKDVYIYGDDVYLYNGPSKIYSKASENKIPKGTTLSYEYIPGYEDQSDILWVYTNYNGIKGWLYIYGEENEIYKGPSGVAKISDQSKSGKVMTIQNIISLREEPSNESPQKSITIPLYTELDYLYYTSASKNSYGYYYITYNGTSGWLKAEEGLGKFRESGTYVEALTKSNSNHVLILNNYGLNLYTEFKNETSSTNLKLPVYSIIDYEYFYQDGNKEWYYITHNNRKYWTYTSYTEYEESNEIAYLNKAKDSYLTISDLKFYRTPSPKAQEITTIPKNTEITKPLYIFTQNAENQNIEYLYIDIDGQKGWIKNENLAAKEEITQKILFASKDIYEEQSLVSKKLATIPLNTTIKTKYIYKSPTANWYYVTYNNINGWITESESAVEKEEKYKVVVQPKEIYSEPNSKSKTLGTIPIETEVEVKYSYNKENTEYYYITFEKLNGWITSNNLAPTNNKKYKILASEGIKIYKTPKAQPESLSAIIPESAIVKSEYIFLDPKRVTYYNEWHYISYKNIRGWIIGGDERLMETDEEEQDKNIEEQPLPNIEPKKEKPVIKNISPKLIISFSIIGAICISLTALVIIILINKQKKAKQISNNNPNPTFIDNLNTNNNLNPSNNLTSNPNSIYNNTPNSNNPNNQTSTSNITNNINDQNNSNFNNNPHNPS